MKKLHLFKRTLLLLALIVGCVNYGWAQTVAVDDVLWTEPFKGTNTSTSFSVTSSWGSYINPTTFVAEDKNDLNYSSSNAMLSSTTSTNMDAAHVWLNKSVDGYIQVTGIKLYNATKVKVSWAQATSGSSATVYYQFDGSGDFTSLSTCSGPNAEFKSGELSVENHTTIALKFMHPKSNSKNTRIDNLTLKVTAVSAPSGTTAAPTISGTTPFLNNTTVAINNAASADGADIFYTLNGSDPTTTTSATCFEYSTPFQIFATTTVKAIAKKSTDTNASSVVSETFTKVTPISVTDALTAIAQLANNETIADQCVTGIVSSTEGELISGAITFSISVDGTATNELQVYKGKGLNGANFASADDIAVGDEVVIYGTLKNYNGTTPEFDQNSYLLSKVRKAATPTFSPAAGAVAEGTKVTISTQTDGATIYYTTNGDTPTTSSTEYEEAITINAAVTIKAIAVKDGLPNSDVATASYTIATPCETPTFSEAAGEVDKGTIVTISSSTEGSTIYYTTDGIDPTTSSSHGTAGAASATVTVNAAMTLKAIAVKDGKVNSDVASVVYTVRDYTTLPFIWEGGTSSALAAKQGVTTNGLGSDYAESNAPYRQKMTAVGNYILVKTNAQPGRVYFGVKMVGGAETSKIKVQESSDGTSFTDVEEFTISGKQNDIHNFSTSNAFNATSRFVKIIKSVHGSNIGVGPITITGCETATVSAAGYATYVTKNNVEFAAGDAYAVSISGDKAVLNEVTRVQAGTAVVLKGEGTKTATVLTETPDAVANDLRVSDGSVAGDGSTIYVLAQKTSGVGFYLLKNDVTIPDGKAYLVVATGARDFIGFDDEGETTAISEVRGLKSDLRGEFFNLNGQRVAQPSKGLYIVNGKKVMFK